jgi:hypothetical protein
LRQTHSSICTPFPAPLGRLRQTTPIGWMGWSSYQTWDVFTAPDVGRARLHLDHFYFRK